MATILGEKLMNGKSNQQQRTERINIRVLPDDAIKLEKMAKQKGIRPSTLAYIIIKEAINNFK